MPTIPICFFHLMATRLIQHTLTHSTHNCPKIIPANVIIITFHQWIGPTLNLTVGCWGLLVGCLVKFHGFWIDCLDLCSLLGRSELNWNPICADCLPRVVCLVIFDLSDFELASLMDDEFDSRLKPEASTDGSCFMHWLGRCRTQLIEFD